MRILLATLAALLIAGCGQKGPLYLPEEPTSEAARPPAAAPAPAAETPAATPAAAEEKPQ